MITFSDLRKEEYASFYYSNDSGEYNIQLYLFDTPFNRYDLVWNHEKLDEKLEKFFGVYKSDKAIDYIMLCVIEEMEYQVKLYEVIISFQNLDKEPEVVNTKGNVVSFNQFHTAHQLYNTAIDVFSDEIQALKNKRKINGNDR